MVADITGLRAVSDADSGLLSDDVDFLSPVEEIIDEARNGRMFILVDDEERENEGDLVIPAQFATPEAVNFMAKHGRGLICLALSPARVGHLGLRLMARDNETRHSTAFTVSIEARDGVTTGISAPDRARTIAVAIDSSTGADDIVSPGHVFPLAAREGGVLVRAGHTEAAVDIARLAGLNPSGVICEIMREDGTMARLPDLVPLAQLHGLKIGAIADLIAYRRRHDRIVERLDDTVFDSRHGGRFRMCVYINKVEYAEHIALVKGDLSHGGPVLVRMHAFNILDDLFAEVDSPRAGELQRSMELIGEAGRGVLVLIREPRRTYITDFVRRRNAAAQRVAPAAENGPARTSPAGPGQGERNPLRDYGVGAQTLLDLGVSQMILLTNSPKQIVGLDGYGLTVVETRPIV